MQDGGGVELKKYKSVVLPYNERNIVCLSANFSIKYFSENEDELDQTETSE